MTHLPFIVAAYTLGVGAPSIFAIAAWQRLRLARRRLAAIDPRNRDLGRDLNRDLMGRP